MKHKGAGSRFRLSTGHFFENRRSRISRLVLGAQIDNPPAFFGSDSYELLGSVPIGTHRSSSDSKDALSASTENEGAAFDAIVFEASDGTLHHAEDDAGNLCCFTVAFGGRTGVRVDDEDGERESGGNDSGTATPPTSTIALKVQDIDGGGEAWFRLHEAGTSPESFENSEKPSKDKAIRQQTGGNAFRDPWTDLRRLLKEGTNHVTFCCLHYHGSEKRKVTETSLRFARASIFLWKASDRVVISDIDGTLTRSNGRGVLGTILTDRYEAASHSGVCHLLSRLANSSSSQTVTPSNELSSSAPTTRVVYLTSRPIRLAPLTRAFLSGLAQHTEQEQREPAKFFLPQGPLLGFGGSLSRVLAMELLSKTTQAFKAGELEKHVAGPLRRARKHEQFESADKNNNNKMFVAAFGNNLNDIQAYHRIGINLDNIFLIDKNSRMVTFDKTIPRNNIHHSSTTNNDDTRESNGEKVFPAHSWYKDRIGTVFENGYSDETLHSFLGMAGESRRFDEC